MAKLLVKSKETGETRPMTKTSFDLAGHKRGFSVVGALEEKKSDNASDIVKAEMERLKAEKALKDQQKREEATEEPEVKEKKKPGPKPKKQSDEV